MSTSAITIDPGAWILVATGPIDALIQSTGEPVTFALNTAIPLTLEGHTLAEGRNEKITVKTGEFLYVNALTQQTKVIVSV